MVANHRATCNGSTGNGIPFGLIFRLIKNCPKLPKGGGDDDNCQPQDDDIPTLGDGPPPLAPTDRQDDDKNTGGSGGTGGSGFGAGPIDSGGTFRGGESKRAEDEIVKRVVNDPQFGFNEKGSDQLHPQIAKQHYSEDDIRDIGEDLWRHNPKYRAPGSRGPC